MTASTRIVIVGGGRLAGGCLCAIALSACGQPAKVLAGSGGQESGRIETALGFAAGFALILLLVSWMNDKFANARVYLAAFISRLIDLDAITISNLKLVSSQTLSSPVVVTAIGIASGVGAELFL